MSASGIALGGFGMSEDLQLSREAGFAEHLVKPLNLNKLQEAMARRVLATRKQLSTGSSDVLSAVLAIFDRSNGKR